MDDLFDPPTVGSSDDTSYIVEQDGSFQTAGTLIGIDNLYLSLDAVRWQSLLEKHAVSKQETDQAVSDFASKIRCRCRRC